VILQRAKCGVYSLGDGQRLLLGALSASSRKFAEIVGAVCHGPAGLVNIQLSNGNYLVTGKVVSGFTNEEEKEVGLAEIVPFLLEEKLAERGATVEKAPNFQAGIVN
jgi:putative intracellular protease/amidase